MIDLYAVLGVERGATTDAIRKAYRRLSMKWHPDMADGNREKFELVATAHRVLSDDEARAHYDRTGTIDDRAPSNEESEVNGTIMEVFHSILGQIRDVETENIIGHMQDALRDAQTQIHGQIEAAKQTIRRYENVKKRLKRKKSAKEATDMFVAMLDNQIGSANGLIAKCEHKKAVFTKALEVVSGYDYDVARASRHSDFVNTYSDGFWK